MHRLRKPTALPVFVGASDGRVFVATDRVDDAETRFPMTINGEPVRPARVAVHERRLIKGLNLLPERASSEDPPWRPFGGTDAGIARCSLPQWSLPDGATFYMRAPPDTQAGIVYVDAEARDVVDLVPSEDYTFCGYFGRHRCLASVQIDVLDDAGGCLTTLSKQVPNASGGAALDRYAKVEFSFHAPAQARAARVRLSIDAYQQPKSGREPAFLFFAHVSLSLDGGGELRWEPASLNDDEMAALSRAGLVVEMSLPRISTGATLAPAEIELIDGETSLDIGSAQLTLPLSPDITFRPTSFDGVTLTGHIDGAQAEDRLALVIDGVVAGHLMAATPSGLGGREIKLRVPDAFLDGAPHVVELRESRSGKTLFMNAVLLRALITPWETLQDFSRLPLPVELHPMARRRYESVVAHLDALTGEEGGADEPGRQAALRQLALAHRAISPITREQTRPMPALTVPSAEACIASILLSTSDIEAAYRVVAALILAFNHVAYEIVIATDDEDSAIAWFERQVSNVRIVRTQRGAGRATMLNRAAEEARGIYLAVLDPSAEPCAHWLDELHLTFDLFEDVGIAAAKAVTPGGRLVAAGGVLRPSGALQPVTASGNPEHPLVAHARVVDYAPLHAAMMPRALWATLGGLSEEFANPSLEDADFALKMRARGLNVVYAPTASVTLHQAPAQRAPAADGLSLFRRRWADALADAGGGTAPSSESLDRDLAGRVLFIDQQPPRADIDAGSYAAVQEIRLFQALGYKVSFLPLNLTHLGVYTRALQRIGVEALHAPFATSIDELLRQRGDVFDLVYVTRHQVARTVLPSIRRWCPRAKVIFNNADLHFLRELRMALAQKNGELLRRSAVTRERELEVVRQADLTLSYSDVEHAVIVSHNLDQGRVAKAPWVVHPVMDALPFEARRDIAFVGSFGHLPNVEAVRFLATRVMPLLRGIVPGVRCAIYGSQITSEVRDLAASDIVVVGHVDDIAAALSAARVFVAPLLSGAGLKGKVLDAMAHGLPCVLSPVAAEGIGAIDGLHYLGATEPAEWAARVAELYRDEARWTGMARESRAFVASAYSVDRGVALLRQALETIDVFVPHSSRALCYRTPLPPLV